MRLHSSRPSIVLAGLLLLTPLAGAPGPGRSQDPAPGLYAEIATNKGTIVLRLEFEKTPLAVASFVGLAEGTIDNAALPPGTPFYDGTKWHRVVPGHVIQCGAPGPGAKAEGPGYQYANEIAPGLSHDHAGAAGIANGGPHTNGAQWYITLGDRSYLDGNLTVFGEVVRGMDVVKAVVQGDEARTVRIVRVGKAAEAFRPTTASFLALKAAGDERVRKEDAERRAREEALIAERWPRAVDFGDGVRGLVLKEGRGEPAAPGAKIRAAYSGTTLLGGLAFVSTADGTPYRGGTPAAFEFEAGKTRLNPGFEAALAAMKPGGKRLLLVPWDKGYGRNGFYARSRPGEKRFVIPPFSLLVVEIEILEAP